MRLDELKPGDMVRYKTKYSSGSIHTLLLIKVPTGYRHILGVSNEPNVGHNAHGKKPSPSQHKDNRCWFLDDQRSLKKGFDNP